MQAGEGGADVTYTFSNLILLRNIETNHGKGSRWKCVVCQSLCFCPQMEPGTSLFLITVLTLNGKPS